MINALKTGMRDGVVDLARSGRVVGPRLAARLRLRTIDRAPVHFVVEEADWAIRRVGTGVRDGIERIRPGGVMLTTNAADAHRRIVHFGSQYMWISWGSHLSRSNCFVTSFFHGKPEDGPKVARHIERFLASVPRLHRIVASNGLLRARLIGWGVPEAKIEQIPIGVDTALFTPADATARAKARTRFGVPSDALCIGSFQKDGVGWGNGMEPKLIKGPDLFADAVADLTKDFPVHVLLTGPARGYVASRLEAAGIPFTHHYLQDYADLRHAYHALDLYLVTSREEGGPMALMESMSARVPVVSTPVGMAHDLVRHGETGWLTEVDASRIAAMARTALAAPDLSTVLDAAQLAIAACDWQVVAEAHWTRVYQPLIQKL